MNSPDPWRVMQSAPSAQMMVLPAPYYAHPFFGRGVPSGLGLPSSGIFIGAEAPQRTGLLAEVAPAIAATSGVTARFELDDRQCLCVTICVDGACYSSSMDLAPAIGAVMAKIAAYHTDLHKTMPPQVSETVVIDAVDKAVTSAGQAMLEDLVGRHVDVISAGWLSSVRGAIGKTLRTLKPVITTVATAAATSLGGPAAGAAAAKFAPMLTDLQASLVDPKKDPKKAAAAQRAIAQLNLEAKADPRVAAALRAAQKAITSTTVAYHVNQTATKAAAGDPAAQRDIAAVLAAAQQGDPVAKSTTDVLTETFAQTLADRAMHSEWGAKLWEQATGRGPATVSGDYRRARTQHFSWEDRRPYAHFRHLDATIQETNRQLIAGSAAFPVGLSNDFYANWWLPFIQYWDRLMESIQRDIAEIPDMRATLTGLEARYWDLRDRAEHYFQLTTPAKRSAFVGAGSDDRVSGYPWYTIA